MSITTLRVIISGRVQGVSYRAWTVETALALGVDGWVRNRLDGTVEAVFSGDEHSVSSMVNACGKGPVAAHVTDIKTEKMFQEPEKGFRPLPTV